MRLKTMEEIDESKEKKHTRKTHKESRRKGLLILHVRCDTRWALPVVYAALNMRYLRLSKRRFIG